MDKLKQVLKYQFWILLVVALIVPVVGWSMARSGMVAETEARMAKLKKTDNDLKAVPDDPNEVWQKGVADVNAVQKSQVRDAWLVLYENQAPFMTWPTNIPDDPAKLEPHQLELYLTKYPPEIERVRQIIKPLDEFGENGLVDFADGMLPHPEDEWQAEQRAPTAREVEGAQEDVWLLTSLLKSVASVNGDAKSQYDAPIKQIVTLYLRGGSANAVGGTAAGAPGTRAPGDEVDMRPMGGGVRGGAPQGGQGAGGSVSFNADEEFGTEAPDPEAGAGAASGGSPAPGQRAPGDEVEAGGARGAGGSSGARMIRYVEDKPEWRSRGFYMELVMDHRKVPDLLVALANSDWPIRVTRVHQADTMDEELVSEDAAGTRALGGGAGDGEGAAMPGGRPRMGGAGGIGARPAPVRMIPGGDEDDRGRGRDRSRGGGGMSRIGGGAPAQAARSAGGGAGAGGGALDDHMLANVAIDGLFTIFKKPPPEEAAPAGSQEAPGSQPEQPATGEEPTAETADAAMEATADEAAASDASDAAEPAAEEPPSESSIADEPDDKPNAEGTEPDAKPATPGGGSP